MITNFEVGEKYIVLADLPVYGVKSGSVYECRVVCETLGLLSPTESKGKELFFRCTEVAHLPKSPPKLEEYL